jgi:hypothetical protein
LPGCRICSTFNPIAAATRSIRVDRSIPSCVFKDGGQSADKLVTVGLVNKDLSLLDVAADDVVQRSGGVYAGFARHERVSIVAASNK